MMAPSPLAEIYAEVVPAELAAERQAQGLTYRALAHKIGSPGSWSSLRRLEIPVEKGGRHTLSVERAVRIAAALNIPTHRLHHYFKFHGVEVSAA